ncbi:MAG: protein-L-isoaspartate(D-aspartate) O-methyltransferase [Pseudomonadota bacterium]
MSALHHHHLRGLGMTSDSRREKLIAELRQMGIRNERVLTTIRNIPRHEFIGDALKGRAYDNDALPIGQAQTISQPYIVAKMTEAILEGGAKRGKVLEIGTGCGYQTAVLAALLPRIFTIERLRYLSEQARVRLARLGCHNVVFNYGDGHLGWKTHAPYDAIVVTAATANVPLALKEQLAPGGRLIIPVGPEGAQALRLIENTGAGFKTRDLETVSFVPLLTGKA